MKSVSKPALAAAMILIAPALFATTPALAQKKGKEAAGPQLKLSANFRKAAAEAEQYLIAKDWAGAKPKVDALSAIASGESEKYYAAQFRLQVASNSNDTPGTIAALDALLHNSNTPQADLGRYNFFRGDHAYQQRKYADAAAYLIKARDLGYVPHGTNLELRIAQALLDGKQVAPGVAAIDRAVRAEEAAGRKAPESWYKIAVSRLYGSGDKAGAAAWLGRQVAAWPSADAWRNAVLVYMEHAAAKGTALDADQRLDLLRLMRAAKALAGESDYYEYADAAQRRGLPWEAKSVIDEARASGKALKPNPRLDPIYTQALNREKAEKPLATQEKAATGAANGTAAMSVADAYLAGRNLPKAIELYRLALQKGGVDAALVNSRLGIALALSGQKAEAKAAFAGVSGGPRGDIAKFWTAWVDQAA